MGNLKWVDVAKGIGILLVIVGHNNFNPFLITTIYTFHMPFFFFISGYLYNHGKYKKNFCGFVFKKFNRLVLPYFITNFTILSFYALLTFFKLYHSFNSDFQKSLIEIFYGNGAPLDPPTVLTNQIDTPSWFLLCLFCSSLLLFILAYSHEKYGLQFSIFLSLLIILGGFEISKYMFLPWSFDIACVSMIFMFSGYLIKYFGIYKLNNYFKTNFFTLISILTLFIIISIDGYVNMNRRVYPNLLFFSIGGLLGTHIMLLFAKKISNYENILIKLICFLGKNSLIIFLYQSFSPLIALNLMNKFVHIDELINSSPVLSTLNMVIFTLLTVIVFKKIHVLDRVYSS